MALFGGTHKLIAKKIFKLVSDKYGIEMNYKSLSDGSVAPDVVPTMIAMSHCKEGSMDMLMDRIKSMMHGGMPLTKKEMAQFSYDMGIIIHFLSDYFCRAHNDRRYKNLIIHFIYENRLGRYFDGHEPMIDMLAEIVKKGNWIGVPCIRKYIDEKHREYGISSKSMADDMLFSLRVSSVVALNIVDSCLGASRPVLMERPA